MLLIWKRDAVAGFLSVSSFPTTYRPADSAASASITGASIRHGGHHVAQQSISTGFSPASARTRAKLASVTSIGCEESAEPSEPPAPGDGSFAPHLPHTG